MCGIVGLVQWNTGVQDTRPLLKMADAIRHRGPDDVGYIFGNVQSGDFALFGGADTPEAVWQARFPHTPPARLQPASIAAGAYHLGLANRRLSIVDLSPAGHQPLCNEDRSLWVVFNGEIYNLPALRAELAALGHTFISHSDTEILVHAYETWGAECVTRFNGMWAFAIWDIPRRQLFLARDRVGIKPLYYWHDAQRLAFASEIKSLLALDIPRRANPQAVYDFLAANLSDHTTFTFFEGVVSLPPAHMMRLDLPTGQIEISRYWSLDPTRRLSLASEIETTTAFRDLFEDAVRVHLLSDVPVGTCLSGGLDSSSVVGVIARLIGERGLRVVGMENRQKTFSARYADFEQDEGAHIAQVVNRFDVDPYMTYPAASMLQDEWFSLFYHLEEPFGSTSIFAQRQVFELARQSGVTVTLDGQGGDELLAGYLGFFPYYFLDLLGGLKWGKWWDEFRAHCTLHKANARQEIKNMISNMLPAQLRLRAKSRLLSRRVWLSPQFVQQVQPHINLWEGAGRYMRGFRLSGRLLAALHFDPLPSLLRFDDRNSMAFSVESRVPFLDYRLIEFCFALSPDYKIRQGVTKYILRQAMSDVLPPQIISRQDKIGFSTPQDRWLRELTPWLREVFASPEFRQRPYFQTDQVHGLLDAHATQRQNNAAILWRILAVELWHRAMKV